MSFRQLRWWLLVPAVCTILVPGRGDAPGDAEARRFASWEPSIAAFERRDRERPPPENGIVFVGSSSIRLWDLPGSFPGLPVINRGFGGSQLADSVHFARRIVTRYRPRTVVLYAGDNDIAFGKAPEQVSADFRAFVGVVRRELPETKVIYLSIKPSIARWSLVGKMRRANALIEQFCRREPGLVYVDVATPLLDADGKPRRELFRADGLHLNANGYAVWAAVLRPYLK